MFRPSPAIVAWGLMARNPQAEPERLAFWKTTAATRWLAVEREGAMSQLPAGSLAWLMVLVLMLLVLMLPVLTLPVLTLPVLTRRVLLFPLLPSCQVPLPTHRAGHLPVGHWNLTTDIQSVKESDPDTKRSPWYLRAQRTRRRPRQSPELWIGNNRAGSGQGGDRPEARTHPALEGVPPAAYLSRLFQQLLSIR
jgi:hypothetical protein